MPNVRELYKRKDNNMGNEQTMFDIEFETLSEELDETND